MFSQHMLQGNLCKTIKENQPSAYEAKGNSAECFLHEKGQSGPFFSRGQTESKCLVLRTLFSILVTVVGE